MAKSNIIKQFSSSGRAKETDSTRSTDSTRGDEGGSTDWWMLTPRLDSLHVHVVDLPYMLLDFSSRLKEGISVPQVDLSL